MKLDHTTSALVIVGGWNSRIFTPPWIKKYLFPGENEDFTIEMPAPFSLDFNTQFISPRISSKEVRILLQENRLSFSPVENRNEHFDQIQELALQLADYLPHTPVTAYGVNFLFTEHPISEEMVNRIRPRDLEEFEQINDSLTSEQYTRRLSLYGRTLNFTVKLDGDKAAFDFNFHFKIGDLVAFKAKIAEISILELKHEAVQFMSEIYHLELEEELNE
ncbi:MAG: hypothetical protein OXI43_21245 [Candidatus Poribacteria bacterium]|nr:hypothetical protein [Candidatus Poribacteria bacterium]